VLEVGNHGARVLLDLVSSKNPLFEEPLAQRLELGERVSCDKGKLFKSVPSREITTFKDNVLLLL
jgi:hypothetical protein